MQRLTSHDRKKCELWRDSLTPTQRKKLRPGKAIGRGEFACAFTVEGDDTRVVKLTSDRDDAASFSVLGRKNLTVIPKVYGVHRLARPKSTFSTIYLDNFAIEVERVKPVPETGVEAASINLLSKALWGYGEGNLPKRIDDQTRASLDRKCARMKTASGKKAMDACRKVVAEAISVYETLKAAKYDFEDASARNWGRNSEGRLVALDLGWSTTAPKNVKVPALAGMLKPKVLR